MRAWVVRKDGLVQRYNIKSVKSLREKGYEYDRKRRLWYKPVKPKPKKRKVKLTVHVEYKSAENPIIIDVHVTFWWDGQTPLEFELSEYERRVLDYLSEEFGEALIANADVKSDFELDVKDSVGVEMLVRRHEKERPKAERLDLDEI